jgi:hypothetical protein
MLLEEEELGKQTKEKVEEKQQELDVNSVKAAEPNK